MGVMRGIITESEVFLAWNRLELDPRAQKAPFGRARRWWIGIRTLHVVTSAVFEGWFLAQDTGLDYG